MRAGARPQKGVVAEELKAVEMDVAPRAPDQGPDRHLVAAGEGRHVLRQKRPPPDGLPEVGEDVGARILQQDRVAALAGHQGVDAGIAEPAGPVQIVMHVQGVQPRPDVA